jgi:hypothetical protein
MAQHISLRYRIVPQQMRDSYTARATTQFLPFDRKTRVPSTLGGLYGAHLAQTTKKPTTAKKYMEATALLLAWAPAGTVL